jgi:DNA (cytosine-5)-methyltransferase 1
MRLLDLFCGGGLASWGYWNSGRFSEIVGVDVDPKMSSSYSFDFICQDCLTLDYDFLSHFDFIHASPPCQAYSNLPHDRSLNMRLIPVTKLMLHASGVPHVIENVRGAVKELRPNFSIDGHYVGLPLERVRYFYISSLAASHQLLAAGTETISPHGSEYVSRSDLFRAFGLNDINELRSRNLTIRQIEEGIPPRITEYIARMLIASPDLIM